MNDHNANLRRSAGAIRAGCSLLVTRAGCPVYLPLAERMAIVRRMEAEAARWDNGNRELMDDGALRDLCHSDYIAETVRYYREQADNIMAEVTDA